MRTVFAAAMVLLAAGCGASSADTLRQSTTVADSTLKSAYVVAVAWNSDALDKIDAEFKAGQAASAQRDFSAHQASYQTVRKALDGANAALKGIEDLIPAVESGQRSDVSGLVASIAKTVGDLVATLQSMGVKL